MVLKTAQIPRDISIQKMLDYINYVHRLGQEKIPNPKPGTKHNARYTAKVFGFLDARGRLTASGNALVELPDIDSKKSRMAIAYENTDCIKAWIE